MTRGPHEGSLFFPGSPFRVLSSPSQSFKESKVDEETREESLDHVGFLFAYIVDKDIFHKYYSKLLSKRIIQLTSVSDEAEERMLENMRKVKCVYIYIYIYNLLCVCVCVRVCGRGERRTIGNRRGFFQWALKLQSCAGSIRGSLDPSLASFSKLVGQRPTLVGSIRYGERDGLSVGEACLTSSASSHRCDSRSAGDPCCLLGRDVVVAVNTEGWDDSADRLLTSHY